MFNFFHRTKTIHVDAFTSASHVYELTPIVKASKAIPGWWKNAQPAKPMFDFSAQRCIRDHTNMKACYGFMELYKRGFVLESWADFHLANTHGSCVAIASNGLPPATSHPKERLDSFPNYTHLRLMSPWKIREKTGVQFHCGAAWWSLSGAQFIIPSGIIAFDFNDVANVNLLVPIKADEQQIAMGTPLLHFVPLSDDTVEVKNHLVSEKDMSKYSFGLTSFYGWRTTKRVWDRNKERN